MNSISDFLFPNLWGRWVAISSTRGLSQIWPHVW
jgi:hypothetical protein